jgi:8-hydroxy-5-deazaflavin:NADPH oxidoreductase
MKIGIVGTGNIGGTLGRRWAARHDVVFGTRDPGADDVKTLLAEAGSQARAATVPEAVGFGEVVLLAVPHGAVADVLKSAPPRPGTIVIDATNPVGAGLLPAMPAGTSGGETVAALAPGARVVKAFNTAGFNVYAQPDVAGAPATLYLCGDDAGAKATVSSLAAELGLEPVDCGPLAKARLLEPVALLWITLSQTLGRDIALRLIRKAPGKA